MIKLIIKGFIIGIGKIIPGVSGALLAISLGVYEKALDSIATFFKNPIKNFNFLFPLLIGAVLSISLTSKFLIYLLNNYYHIVMLLFIGLILGSIVPIFKEVDFKNKKSYISLILSFSLVMLLSLKFNNVFNIEVNNIIIKYFMYFIIGVIDAITMIVPGISGTAVLMILGLYEMLLNLLASLSSIKEILNNLNILIPYFLAIIVTVILLSKLMNYLFKNKRSLMYSSILGFSLSSVFVLLIKLLQNKVKLYYFIFFIIGFIISIKLENKS